MILCGQTQLLLLYSRGREVEYVSFQTDVSQGSQTGSGCSSLGLYTLLSLPTHGERILSIFDVVHFAGTAGDVGVVFSTFLQIVLHCLKLEDNLSKSSLALIQAP
jgi:hypothetical protein